MRGKGLAHWDGRKTAPTNRSVQNCILADHARSASGRRRLKFVHARKALSNEFDSRAAASTPDPETVVRPLQFESRTRGLADLASAAALWRCALRTRRADCSCGCGDRLHSDVREKGGPMSLVRVSYFSRRVRCGKRRCQRCAKRGPGHGPYWYGFWIDPSTGRKKSFYCGRRFNPPQALTPRGFRDVEDRSLVELQRAKTARAVDSR
jgi:hypothetical protein